jgi:hypothetical protein
MTRFVDTTNRGTAAPLTDMFSGFFAWGGVAHLQDSTDVSLTLNLSAAHSCRYVMRRTHDKPVTQEK